MGRLKSAKVVRKLPLHISPADEGIVPKAENTLQVVAKDTAGQKTF